MMVRLTAASLTKVRKRALGLGCGVRWVLGLEGAGELVDEGGSPAGELRDGRPGGNRPAKVAARGGRGSKAAFVLPAAGGGSRCWAGGEGGGGLGGGRG
jgi:hypothetical protein